MLTKSEVGKYRLKFMPEALGEWNALDGGAKGPLRLAAGKRENMAAYLSAAQRLSGGE